MNINKVAESRVPENLNDVSFGNVFTDHIFICNYKDGKWGEGQIIPSGSVSFPPTIMAIHYGQACFEGMKAYKNDTDDVYLFRPDRNAERINASATRLAMPTFPEDEFMEALHTLVDLDRAWVPNKLGTSLYIRPVLFASESMLLARVSNEYTFCIICTVANNYYSKPLNVKIAQKYSRAAKGGVGFAKAAGNYGASFYPTQLAKEEGFDQVIWTDSVHHEFIEESGTMNVFIRINDTLITPPISERILNGVTRDSLIQIAKHKGWNVIEKRVSIHDLYEAHKDGSLKEVFGCGTAVVVNNFVNIGYPQETLALPDLPDEEKWGQIMKKELLNIQSGRADDPFGWRQMVEHKTMEV